MTAVYTYVMELPIKYYQLSVTEPFITGKKNPTAKVGFFRATE